MKRLLVVGLMILGLSVFGFGYAMPSASAVGTDDVCAGLEGAGGNGCDPGASDISVESTVQTAINIVSWIVGIIAVIMIIVGGAKYVTSGGDSNGVQSAKNTIMYALIGIVIVALAQVIVQFTLRKTTDQDALNRPEQRIAMVHEQGRSA